MLDVYRANARAAREYMHPEGLPERYPGRVTLFRAAEGGGSRGDDLGWSRVSDEPVDVHVVPGGHLTFLAEPAVRDLARELRSCLEAAPAQLRSR